MKKSLVMFVSAMMVMGVSTIGAEYNFESFKTANKAIFVKTAPTAEQITAAEALINDTVCVNDGQRSAVVRLFSGVDFQKAAKDATVASHIDAVKGKIATMKYDVVPNALDIAYIWFDDRADQWYTEMKKDANYKTAFRSAGHVCQKLKKYDEAYELYSGINDVWRAMSVAKILKSPSKVFVEAKKLAIYTQGNATTFGKEIDIVIDMCVGNDAVDQNEVKTLFQNINRKYSSMLIKDKASWEPHIAKVRTVISAF